MLENIQRYHCWWSRMPCSQPLRTTWVYPRLLGTVAGELETKALKLMYNHGLNSVPLLAWRKMSKCRDRAQPAEHCPNFHRATKSFSPYTTDQQGSFAKRSIKK
jgi:hypothetical protein